MKCGACRYFSNGECNGNPPVVIETDVRYIGNSISKIPVSVRPLVEKKDKACRLWRLNV